MPRFKLRTKLAIIVFAIVSAAAVGALVERPAVTTHPPVAVADPEYLIFLTSPDAFGDRLPPRGSLSERHVGFGLSVATLATPVEILKEDLIEALDRAEATGYPLLIQFDDWNRMFRSEDPEIVEWTAFPDEGKEYGPIATERWVYRDGWRKLPAPPNVQSDRVRAEVGRRLSALGRVIAERNNAWLDAGRPHLLAGVLCGWKSGIYRLPESALGRPPGRGPSPVEPVTTGYAALTARGHTAESVRRDAREAGMSEDEYINRLLTEVVHDYADFCASSLAKAGVPRERLYTHFAAWRSLPEERVPEYIRDDGTTQPLFAANNAFSRPGLALEPGSYDLDAISETLTDLGQPCWAATGLESLRAETSVEETEAQIERLFDSGVKLACVGDAMEPVDSLVTLSDPELETAVEQWLDQ